MTARRTTLIALTGVALAAAGGGAIAATSTGTGDPEQAILDDAAERLDVSPQELRDALAAARDAQLDKAVREGRLTREQADALERRLGDHVLGPPVPAPGKGPWLRAPHGPRFGFGFGFGPRAEILGAVTKALGITRGELFRQLRAGKSVGEIARANGRTLDDVNAAVRAAVEPRLDRAVKDGRLTREHADAVLDRIGQLFEHFGARPGPPRFRGHHGFRSLHP